MINKTIMVVAHNLNANNKDLKKAMSEIITFIGKRYLGELNTKDPINIIPIDTVLSDEEKKEINEILEKHISVDTLPIFIEMNNDYLDNQPSNYGLFQINEEYKD